MDHLPLYIFLGVLVALKIWLMSILIRELFEPEDRVVMSVKEYNAALNKAYLQGYQRGLSTGRQEGLMSRYTPNEIRKCLGLEPITEEPKTNLD